QSQNLCLRWVREEELLALHAKLAGLGLARTLPPVLRDMTVCAGAATCKLGICLSRGLAQAVANELQRSEINLAGLGEVRLSISGCPDACGRHPVAQVGLYGAARRVGATLAPYYILQLGGRVGEGRTRLADGHTGVPARNVPAFLKDLFAAVLDSGDGAGFDAFLDAGGRERAEELARRHREIPGFEQDPSYYVDWSADGLFSLAGRGPGECGAGVFDLIEVDLASAAAALADGRCFAATVHAARALLVTRGVEPCDSLESLELFRKLFLAEGLLKARFAPLVEEAIRCASLGESDAEFRAQPEQAGALLAAVKALYESMDSSLRFTAAGGAGLRGEPVPCCGETAAPGVTAIAAAQPCPDRVQDFRGVACPLNYVKTKLTLEQMQRGQILAVLLDEQGSRNVPASVSNDGHAVLSVEPEDRHWRVLIRKAG
ncbi:MAG: sulfurtransferase TusA family protein, partial [Gemmatimonadetes bacterium]|nr:sulfurtransferase TusA family protein [Gemmatimonadota bacterium]